MKIKIILVCVAILGLIIVGCQSKKKYYTLYISTPNANGVKEGTEVLDRGIKIGFVKDYEFDSLDVILKVEILREISVPINSVFYLDNTDLFTRCISVNRNIDKSKGNYEDGDTIKCKLDYFEIELKNR